jgi:hypothetical protein
MRLSVPKPGPPVVPGHEPEEKACTACRTTSGTMSRSVVAGMDMILCVDAVACGRRYRKGSTHEQYAEALREGIPQ